MATASNLKPMCCFPGRRRLVAGDPPCPQLSRTHGLCRLHYMAARRLVRAGKRTWAKLESLGLARKPAEKSRDVFMEDE